MVRTRSQRLHNHSISGASPSAERVENEPINASPNLVGGEPTPAGKSSATSVHSASSSRHTSHSSRTVRTLALQAEHARRLAEIEKTSCNLEHTRRLAEIEKTTCELEHARRLVEIEKKACDLEFQSKLAKINTRGDNSSCASDRTRSRKTHCSTKEVEKWLCENTTQQKNRNPNNNHLIETLQVSWSPPIQTKTNEGYPASGPCSALPAATEVNAGLPTSGPFLAFPAATEVPAGIKTPTLPNASEIQEHTNCNNNIIKDLTRAIENLGNRKQKVSISSLPIFDGRISDWLIFKRLYEDTKLSFTAAENLLRLNNSLRGQAREAVAILLVAAHDPDQVVAALDQRFGRSELILLYEINRIKSLPKLSTLETPWEIIEFACKIRNCVETIKLLNQAEFLASPELSMAIIGKLTPALRALWAHFAFDRAHICNKLELLSQFLDHEANVRSRFGFISENEIEKPYFKSKDKAHLVTTGKNIFQSNENSLKNPLATSSNQPTIFCNYCSDNTHKIDNCSKFLVMSIDDRWQWAKEQKVCHRCLKKGNHRYRFCKPKDACNIEGCSKTHHKLLHLTRFQVNIISDEQIPTVSELTPVPLSIDKVKADSCEVVAFGSSRSDLQSQCFTPLLKIAPVTVTGSLGSVDTFALLDDGSTGTFIDSKVAQSIGVSGPLSSLRLDCINGLSKDTNVQIVDFTIKGKYCNESFEIKNARSIKNLNLRTSHSISTKELKTNSHLIDLQDVLSFDSAVPTLLIGIDNWHLIISKETRQNKSSNLVGCRTALGWVIFGLSNSRTSAVNFVNHCNSVVKDNVISSIIENYYKLDSIGITKSEPRSKLDNRAIQILEKTARRLPNGQFEVGLLWRDDNLKVPQNSYNLALSRLNTLERKFTRDPKYAEQYRFNVQASIDKGYVEPCHIESPSQITWYLPHFGVTNPNKPGKLRVVHDAAAKCEGVSLNSLLLAGPDLLQSILDILLRFREGRVALSADIREMFPQVKIRPDDRDAQRFLWRTTPDAPVTCFRMSSMIFGAASSPCTALYVKNKNALEFLDAFPRAVDAIQRNHYMDDYLGSLDTVDEAALIARDILYIHSKGNFEMRAWVSNMPEALKYIPVELHQQSCSHVSLGSSVPQSVRTLGLIWNPVSDTIGFNIKSFYSIPGMLTKRIVLSLIMCVFDPLGLLSPLTIRGRMLFQDSWRSGIDWDTDLPLDQCSKWREWFSHVFLISNLNISRWYLSKGLPSSREIHVFCDASQKAYAAVAYWRFIFPDGSVQLSLICSKARVAPLKVVSIPRLELQAALIAARLAATICEAVANKPLHRYFWCDSKNVLCWVRNTVRTFKPFVSHRIAEISELTSVAEWRWVPTSFNVADDATRFSSKPLSSGDRWFQGPSFLLSSSDSWPEELSNENLLVIPELAINNHLNFHINSYHLEFGHPLVANSSNFSSWLKFLRATALAHKYIKTLRIICLKNKGIDVNKISWFNNCIASFTLNSNTNNCTVNDKSITSEDLETARIHIFRTCQEKSFFEEVKAVCSKIPLPQGSKLRQLKVVLCARGLLRLDGRINAIPDCPEVSKQPIILDGNLHAIRLLLLYMHGKSAHGNNEMVLNEIRQKYYIFRLRSIIRKVSRECQLCKIRKATPVIPTFGNLPICRLAHHHRPFSFTGLDYFGPVLVSVGRRTEKRYVAVLTCLTSRALHLEVVFNLSADAAVMALRRFITRRGTPTEIWSDNGTAFVGASKELRELYGSPVSDHAANEGISWRFIPPGAPFMGGTWERLVRSVKTALKITLKERKPRDELLQTLLAEAENLINSRPLTYIAADAEEEALTPNHFLLGSSSGAPVTHSVSDRDLLRRSDWKKAVRLSDHFWQRWLKEYLPTLIPRRISPVSEVNLRVGDVVIIVDPNLPRGIWPKGIVTKVFPGGDGLVRVAEVKTAAGVFKRPARKIIRLPVD